MSINAQIEAYLNNLGVQHYLLLGTMWTDDSGYLTLTFGIMIDQAEGWDTWRISEELRSLIKFKDVDVRVKAGRIL